jgi:hypothetical protein
VAPTTVDGYDLDLSHQTQYQHNLLCIFLVLTPSSALQCRGETAVTIAKKLNIAHKTVNTHRYHLHEKLNVKTDVELMHFALHNGLIEKDPLHE